MKGYLTVFLSLSLSLLTGFLLFLVGNAVNNAWKIRLEGITDIGMNSILGEYEITLQERYGLFYVDTSYRQKSPSLQNMEERLAFYITENLMKKDEAGPWGSMLLTDVSITEAVSAASGKGKSMKRQAVEYVHDCGLAEENNDLWSESGELYFPEAGAAEEEWRNLMEQIAEMELPKIQNESGQWEDVLLENPADGIFAMMGSDVLYLTGADMNRISIGQIQKDDYISSRRLTNDAEAEKVIADSDTGQFLIYLSEKMGNYRQVRPDSLLQFQLEYIAKGEASDYENLREVVRQLIRWRFAINVLYAMNDAGLYGEASEAAQMIAVVQLNPAFGEPVTKSILYACAYLESIRDVRCLLEGGRVPIQKSGFVTRIENVLTREVVEGECGDAGFSYEEYLLYMVYLLPENKRNLRVMDIMEMDVRNITGNAYFTMDYCIERYTAEILAKGNAGNNYRIYRTYGYY